MALLGGCGGDTAPKGEAQPTASHDNPPTASPGSEHAPSEDSELTASHGSEHTASDSAEHTAPSAQASIEPQEQTVMTVATRTAGALTGSDWGLVYDLSCPALVGDQSREAYVAGLSAAGSPAQLTGGTLTAGSPTTAAGIDVSELPVATGEVRWVQMLQDEGVLGVARFVDAGEGFRYCGLSM